MVRCLLAAVDGSPAAHSALRYALDFASALRIPELSCLCVPEECQAYERSFAPALVGAEMAHSTGSGGVILLDEPVSKPRPSIDPERVLETCAREVLSADYRYTPLCAWGQPSEVIAATAHIGQLLFLGRNSDSALVARSRLGQTVSRVLQTVHVSVVVCPMIYAPMEQIVVLLAGDVWDAELVATAAMWASAMQLPARVVADASRSSSPHAIKTAVGVLAEAGVEATDALFQWRPEEFAHQLKATDLLLVARRRRWRVLHLWFGSTERVVEQVTGPVAVLANP